MENHPGYFSEIVYLRAIALLAVISLHVFGFYTNLSSITFLALLSMSVDIFSRFAVPLFVCISGFVLYNKYQGSYSLKIFYKKRFLSVVPQYTIFSLVWILFIYVGRIYLGREWNFNAIDIARDIIFRYLTGTAFYHLWFFVLIIQLYILYPLIEKVFTKSVENHKTFGLLIFLLIVQVVYQIFSIQNIFLIGNATMFLSFTFYFVLGMYVRSYYLDCKTMVMNLNFRHSYFFFFSLLFATILGIGSLSIESFRNDLIPQVIQIYNWIYAIVTPFYIILIFVLCLYVALKISEMIPTILTKWLQIIGNYSFGIYLIHGFILYALTAAILPKLGFNSNIWLFYPVLYILVLSLSLVFVYVMNKIPYHEYIIGSSR